MQEEDIVMSLELIREAVSLSQSIGKELTQTVVENDIIVPDIKPDVSRILLLDADIFVKGTEVVHDRIQINGTIGFKILYISDDPEQNVKSINSNVNFSQDLDVPGAREGMRGQVKCDIEHVDYSILNGRKINTRAILRLEGKVINDIQQEIVRELDGIEDLQVLREETGINCSLGKNETELSLKELLEVPAGKPTIVEVLRNDIKITGKDFKVTEGKVMAKGELSVSTLYISDDEGQSIQSMEHGIPFSQLIDFDDVDENCSCEVEYRITDSSFDAQEDSDGELRLLTGDVSLVISVSAVTRKSIEVISDAYSPNLRLSLEKEPVTLEEIAAENKSQIILKDTLTLEEDAPDITEVFNVLCKPSLSEYKITDNKLHLEGLVNYNVLYLSNSTEDPVYCSKREEFFRHSIDLRGIRAGMDCEVDLDVEHCNYSMVSSNEVEVRLILNATVKVTNPYTLPLIVKATETPLDDKRSASRPSIIIYFAQPGDTLWKISKKYFMTINDVQKANNIGENDAILPGQQVIIPNKIN